MRLQAFTSRKRGPSVSVIASCLVSLLAGLPVAAQESREEADRLRSLEQRVYERRVSRDPILATRLGVEGYNDRWPDMSMAAWDTRVAQTRQELAELKRIDAGSLDADAALDYQAFAADLRLRKERYRWRWHFNPVNQIIGPHLQVAGVLINYQSVENSQDAKDFIQRLRTAGAPLGQVAARLDERSSRGFHMPASVLPRLINGAEAIIAGGVENNVVLASFRRKLGVSRIPAEEQQALINEAEQAFNEGFVPAYRAFIAALEDQRDTARADAGAWSLPDGAAFYEFLVDQFTTANLDAEAIHELGLKEVARIHGEMNAIREQVGFEGDLAAFFQHLKTAPRFYLPDSEAGRAEYLAMARDIVDGAIARMDEILPVPLPNALEVRRIEPYREKSAPVGFYEAGNVAEDRPGTVYLGMYDMSNLATYDLPALLYHEGVPGHHLQASIMQAEDIPEVRKYYVWWSNTAYTEGWGLYAESLAGDLGLYDDPYARFGRLAGELWRACRLVVDSGLHARKWSRERAIQYLADNTASSAENNARAVDRYLAVPGQATAFKIGMMKIQELRRFAREALGSRFDPREFHYLVLRGGPLPLSLLEQRVQTWTARQSSAE